MKRNKHHRLQRLICALCLLWIGTHPIKVFASELIRLNTRPDASVPLLIHQTPNAQAMLVILPGGAGGFGKLLNSEADGRNFLVRSVSYFWEQGLSTAILGKPSDIEDLDYVDRIGERHQTDIEAVVNYLQERYQQPLWLVGTSRGTVSATAAAIRFGNSKLAGIVLSSSIVSNRKPGAIPFQALDKIHIPVLVVHHETDACAVCTPSLIDSILQGLTHSKEKQLLWMRGGEANGDPCEAFHFHGFNGIEADTIGKISTWIKQHPNTKTSKE